MHDPDLSNIDRVRNDSRQVRTASGSDRVTLLLPLTIDGRGATQSLPLPVLTRVARSPYVYRIRDYPWHLVERRAEVVAIDFDAVNA